MAGCCVIDILKRATEGELYSVLELESGCKPEDVRSAYKRLSLLYHPDKNTHERAGEAFVAVFEAYSLLSDPFKRKEYDDRCALKQEQRQRQAAEEHGRAQEQQQQRGTHASEGTQHHGRHNTMAGTWKKPKESAQRGPGSGHPSNSNAYSCPEPRNASSRAQAFEAHFPPQRSSSWVPKASFTAFPRAHAGSSSGTTSSSSSVPHSGGGNAASSCPWHANKHASAPKQAGSCNPVGPQPARDAGGPPGREKADEGLGWGWSRGAVSHSQRLMDALSAWKDMWSEEQKSVRELATVRELYKRGVQDADIAHALLAARPGGVGASQAGWKTTVDGEGVKRLYDGDRMCMLLGGGKEKDVFVWVSRQAPAVLQWRVCNRASQSGAPDGGIVVSSINKIARLKCEGDGGSFSVTSAGANVRLRASDVGVREAWISVLESMRV